MTTRKYAPFKPSKAAEASFGRALRQVGRASGHIVDAHVDGSKLIGEKEMRAALAAYSKLLTPWARRQAAKMLEQVSKSNRTAYQKAANAQLQEKNAKEMGRLLRITTAESGVREVAAALANEQVGLITSIPLRAGERAQKLALEAVFNGTRADEIAEALSRSTDVSESDAARIARTEVARSNAALTQARAQGIGAKWYIWRTTMDGAEREAHAQMNGEHVKYSEVPELSDGTRGHAGTFPYCRCWQDVQFDDSDFDAE